MSRSDQAIELRTSGGLTSPAKGKLAGYAAVFNSESQDLGGFVEVIRPGAFAASLGDGANVSALWQHADNALLGTTRAGTLRLREDQRGLAFELDLPPTTVGNDLAVLVERGDVAGCSFGFRVRTNGDKWEVRGSTVVRELLDVQLIEITLTHDPAYIDTTVAKRSLAANLTPILPEARWLETIR